MQKIVFMERIIHSTHCKKHSFFIIPASHLNKHSHRLQWIYLSFLPKKAV